MKSATRNFHVPLPITIDLELRAAAKSAGVPATKLALAMIRRGLEEQKRARRRRDIAAYAIGAAGTSDDLDAELEAASLALLLGRE